MREHGKAIETLCPLAGCWLHGVYLLIQVSGT